MNPHESYLSVATSLVAETVRLLNFSRDILFLNSRNVISNTARIFKHAALRELRRNRYSHRDKRNIRRSIRFQNIFKKKNK